MSNVKMKIENRTGIGSNRVRKMRVENYIPGVVYSRGEETKVVNVKNTEFMKAYKVAGSTAVIDLDLDGEILPVIIKNLQRDPVKGHIIHVDYQKLNMDEKIKMNIPIHLLNRDSILLQPSILMHLLDEVEIECLPGNIPTAAEVDVENMDFTTPKYVKDLNIANDPTITILTDLDVTVCSLSAPSTYTEEDDAEETEDVAEVGEHTEE